MAEHSKGGIFTRAQKTLTRTKAKVLQNLGKAEKTSDEKLDEYVHKLDKQQETANKFQKELRTYINAAKAMQNASRSLFTTIQETYEDEWDGGNKIHENLQVCVVLKLGCIIGYSIWGCSDNLKVYYRIQKWCIHKHFQQTFSLFAAMQNASRSLFTTIQETYEDEWDGGNKIHENLQSVELMWADYIQNLQERVQEPMTAYISHITPLRARIAKRGRKLVDYDNTRHNLEVVQNAKKRDENKISKAKEDAEQAKMIYTEMNDYLHVDLPEFYKSRVSLYGSTFDKLFGSECMFHSELGKLAEDIGNFAKKLSDENQFTYRPRPISKALSHENTHVVNGENGDHTNGNSGYESSSPATTPTRPSQPPMLNGHDEDEGHHSPPESPLYQNNLSFQETVALSPPQVESKPDTEETASPQDESEPSQPADVEQTSPTHEEVTTTQSEENEEKVEEMTKSQETPTSDDTPSQEVPDKVNPDDAPDYPPPAVPTIPPPTTRDSPVMQMTEEESLPSEEPEPQAEEAVTQAPVYDIVPSPAEAKPKEDEVDMSKFNDDNLYEVPKSNAPLEEKLPDGALYKVVTTHSYKREDDDELSFEKGDIIYVMTYNGSEDLDDGWLMGMKKSTGILGVFPENFTKREN
ncbi:myc box-dependent-interacting protein 1-like [Pecten maximus]|uniref:myc box-dependent-interacting protein 1-like n=1 Tax=Pecten maximus TaxID=6579 RepID=UPI001458B780|nr:myc box-dependent-interacting protein 1-like [Pecten maximus]